MKAIMTMLFHVLMFVRIPVKWLLKLGLGLCIFCAVGLLVFKLIDSTGRLPWNPVCLFFGVGFACYLLSYQYDKLLLRLKPDDVDLYLEL